MRTTRKARIFALAASLGVASLFYLSIEESLTSAKSDRLEAIGGVKAYREGRRASLLRLLEHAQAIPDPAVRAIEIERIKARLDGLDEHGNEIGAEAKIERFGN